MATAAVALPTEPTTLYYFLEVEDGGIIETYPGTAFEKRRKHVPHDMHIHDLRSVQNEFSLDRNGFQLVKHETQMDPEFLDADRIKSVYYKECEQLIKKLTGASHVHVMSHMCRRHTYDQAQEDAASKGDKDFVTKNNPARFVHVDQSYRGAEQVLYLNLPEEEADKRRKSRWGIMNVWQPLVNRVERDPLAFCDYQTVDENDFRIVIANLPPPGAGEYGNVSKNLNHKQREENSSNGESTARYEVTNLAYNPNQQWYYASGMTPEEAWVFKIFDSKKDGRARCAVHSSFPIKNQGEKGTPRQSIEVRCFVFWDDEKVE